VGNGGLEKKKHKNWVREGVLKTNKSEIGAGTTKQPDKRGKGGGRGSTLQTSPELMGCLGGGKKVSFQWAI